MNKFDKAVERFARRWNTTPEKVLQLMVKAAKEIGISAVKAK